MKYIYTVGTVGKSKKLHALNFWPTGAFTYCGKLKLTYQLDHHSDFPTCKNCVRVIAGIRKGHEKL